MIPDDLPEDLETFLRQCSSEGSFGPPSEPYMHGISDQIYASDGHIAVRYNEGRSLDLDPDPVRPRDSSYISVLDGLINAALNRSGVSLPAPAIKDPLERIDRVKVPDEDPCIECSGTGRCDCPKCGGTHQCDHCDGEGSFPRPGTVDHLEWPDHTAIRVPNGAYKVDLWQGLYAATTLFPDSTPTAYFPEQEASINIAGLDKEEGVLVVQVGPLDVLLMPLRIDREEETNLVEVPVPNPA